MKAEDFDKIVADVKVEISKIMEHRGQFYAGEDRFSQFKNVGRIKGTDKYDAFHGMWLKHYEALCNFMSKPTLDTPFEQWREKIIDMINYLVLCLGMVTEDFQNQDCVGTYERMEEESCHLSPIDKKAK